MQENHNAPMMPSASRNGFYLGLALILFQAIMYLADIDMKSGLRYVSLLILGVGLFLSTRNYRDQVNGGFVSYGRSVGYGVLISLFSGILTAAFIYALFKFIDPTIIDKMILESEDLIYDTITDEAQAEQAIEMNKKLLTPGFMAMGTVLNNIIIGLIISLILSIFMQKEQALSTFDKDTL